MVDDRHAERREPPRERLADASHADHADRAVAQRRLGERIVLLQPFAGAQIALGLRKLAHGAEQQPERRIGHLLGEHVGRVGGDDAVLARPLGVDMVVADAKTRHDLEAREARHQRPVDRDVARRHREAAHLVGNARQEGVAILGLVELVQMEVRREPVDDDRFRRPDQQYVGPLARHSVFSLSPRLCG